MAIQDYSKLFYCPTCAISGSIFFLKLIPEKALIKQKCPKHGVRTFKIPITQKDLIISEVRERMFLCQKCGQKSKPHSVKESGPFTLFKLDCPEHGDKQPFQRIWTIVYNDISNPEGFKTEEPKVEESQPTPSIEKKVCSNCGVDLVRNEIFCGACGSKVD